MTLDEHIAELKKRWRSPLRYDGQDRDQMLVAEIERLRASLCIVTEQAEAMAYQLNPQDFEQFGQAQYLHDARALLQTPR